MDNQATTRIPTMIDKVEVSIMESMPVQLSLNISGYHPDGCSYPVQVKEQRSGKQVRVEIFREVPVDVMCPQMLTPYSANIKLSGGFEPGQYTLDVNDTIVQVNV